MSLRGLAGMWWLVGAERLRRLADPAPLPSEREHPPEPEPPQPVLTALGRETLALIAAAAEAGRIPPAAVENGRHLADLLRDGSPHRDLDIAGYVLTILDYATDVGEACEDAFRVLTDALGLAAVELAETSAVGDLGDLLRAAGPR